MSKNGIIFKGLTIEERYNYNNSKNEWSGNIKVQSKSGSEIKMIVNPDLCKKLISVCADHLIDIAKETAESMGAEMFEGMALVENKKAK